MFYFIKEENDAVLLDDTYRNFVKVIFPIRPLRYYVIVILSQSQWLNMHEVNNHTITIIQATESCIYSCIFDESNFSDHHPSCFVPAAGFHRCVFEVCNQKRL